MTTPKFIKVSDAGLLLPADAKDWVAVYQPALQLTWSRAALPCGEVDWKRAGEEAAALTLCGWSDWRLGTRLEYAHLIDDDLYDPVIPRAFFDKPFGWHWTGTECAPAGYAWCVYLGGGITYRLHQVNELFVRAVRAGQLLAI